MQSRVQPLIGVLEWKNSHSTLIKISLPIILYLHFTWLKFLYSLRKVICIPLQEFTLSFTWPLNWASSIYAEHPWSSTWPSLIWAISLLYSVSAYQIDRFSPLNWVQSFKTLYFNCNFLSAHDLAHNWTKLCLFMLSISLHSR